MQREYKVQKGESLQDVVVKLYGSLEYQTKFLADNNLLSIDITQSQLYNITYKIKLTYKLISNDNYYTTILKKTLNSVSSVVEFIGYNNDVNEVVKCINDNFNNAYSNIVPKWGFYWSDNQIQGAIYSSFPFGKEFDYEVFDLIELINCEPYFEPFTVVYDDSIIKSVVPAITPSQMETESNLKKYKPFSQQSFFDVSLITTGGLNNIIALAYQNDIDINTFDSAQTPSISYYIDEIENRINYNFMQTLTVKPATAIQLETFVPPTPGTHIAFNESFSNSFN
jgi:hypothetical protein